MAMPAEIFPQSAEPPNIVDLPVAEILEDCRNEQDDQVPRAGEAAQLHFLEHEGSGAHGKAERKRESQESDEIFDGQ